MKRNFFFLLTGAIVLLLSVNFACSKHNDNTSGGGGGSTSGKDSVLLNIGNNIILPGYQSFAAVTVSLDSAVTDFNASPNSTKLANVQSLFKAAYTAWQLVSGYNTFGPASTISPALAGLNLFPVNATKIDSNIVSNNNNVNAFTNATAKGFPAIDYLLFGAGNNTLFNYTSAPTAANRKQYLAAVSTDIKTGAAAALAGWSASGNNYINTFINGTGNSVSSSLGLLINSMVQDFEISKNDRFGIPLGKQPPGTTLPVLPNEVEAYYSGVSIQLALAELKAVQGIYLGSGVQANNNMGLNNYLVKANAKYNGGLLSDTIRVRLAQSVTDMQKLQDPFSTTILTNTPAANTVYADLQKLVVLFKTDMCSALGVLITFGDNDGD
ncbi:MAG: imelysin family protein [Bacteroidota bacterium]